MPMAYSGQPALLRARLAQADHCGQAKFSDQVVYFREYYKNRRAKGLVGEKPRSILATGRYTEATLADLSVNIPVQSFVRRGMMRYERCRWVEPI